VTGTICNIAETFPAATVTHAAKAAHDQWIMFEGFIRINQSVQLLVVLRGRQRELVSDRRVFWLIVGPPGSFELDEQHLYL